MGFLPLLSIIFVIAKLAGLLTWSWWLVFAPALLLPVLGVGMVLFGLISTAILKRWWDNV